MCRKVRVTDSGSSDLIGGALANRLEVENINAELQKRIDAGEEGIKLVEYQQVLLGITKAALANESFLSAASFQETTRVLTEAAIKGKVDPLAGLKENVIIGKLIPAGTGLPEVREDLKRREAERDAAVAAEHGCCKPAVTLVPELKFKHCELPLCWEIRPARAAFCDRIYACSAPRHRQAESGDRNARKSRALGKTERDRE